MKKTIILYDFLLGYGGLERVMAFQAKALRNSSEVTVSFATVNKDTAQEMFKDTKVIEHSQTLLKLSFLKIMWSFANKASLKNFKDKADLFISHSYICSRLCNYMKKKYNIPYAIYLHHPPNFLYLQDKKAKYWGMDIGRGIALMSSIILGPLLRANDKNCVINADKVIANSFYTQQRAKEIYGVESVICYPPVNSMFRIINKRECKYILKKYNINKKFILCHGRLIPDKKYELLVEALKHLNNKDFLVVFSGKITESYKLQLLEIAKKHKVENKMKFLGFVPDKDLISLYNLAEVFAFPATKEDFGLVPVEAMACGCPVVAWDDKAGPSETITNGVNGYLARPYDEKDFADKIEKIIEEEFKTKNKTKIAESIKRFSEKEHARILNESLNSLLQRQKEQAYHQENKSSPT